MSAFGGRKPDTGEWLRLRALGKVGERLRLRLRLRFRGLGSYRLIDTGPSPCDLNMESQRREGTVI